MSEDAPTALQEATGLIPIDLDRRRHLKLDLNALVLLEEYSGKDLTGGEQWNARGARDLRYFLWACLQHEEPGLTLEQVGSLIHVGNLGYVSEQLAKAWRAAMPEAQRGKGRAAS